MKKLYFSFLLMGMSLSAIGQSIIPNWDMRYNGQGDFTDRFLCTTLDNAGNLIAAGYTQRSGEKRDFLVVKFTSSGTTLWRYIYKGDAEGDDEAHAVVVDANNNVYVTGVVDENLGENNIYTLKLTANGALGWAATYNYTSNQDDEADAIALDKSNNVIVAGLSDSDPLNATENLDGIAIKYTAAGAQSWAVRYNGLGNAADVGQKVMTDANDNVLVAGTTDNGSDDDYYLIKYTATGTQTWVVYGDQGKNDRLTDMAIDANQNIYLTGRSKDVTYDYYTMKFSNAGALVWDHVFDNGDDDRAIAIAVAPASGIAYVTGQVSNVATGLYDFRTVQILANGTTGWSNTLYANAAGKDDIPTDIALDGVGDVYVSGNADVSATGVTSSIYDAVLIKYNAAGSQQWLKTYNGAGNQSDYANALAVSPTGISHIVGYTEDASRQRNAVALQYSISGQPNWTSTYNGQGDNADNVRAVVVDNSENSYLAGYTFTLGQDRDILLIKLNNLGDTLWTRKLNGSNNDTDEAVGVGIDPSGNIIVGGFVRNDNVSNDLFIAKFNPNGDTLWTKSYNTAQNKSDKAYDFALDATGNIYLTGRSNLGAGLTENFDVITAKFNNNGVLTWVKTYNSTGTNEDKGEKIKVDSNGDVIVAGTAWNGTDEDIIVIKYNAAGVQQWVKTLTGTSGKDMPNALLLDANSNIYIGGGTTSGTEDLALIKYDAAGNLSWHKTYNGSANLDDEASSMVYSNFDQTITLTGYSTSANGRDVCTIQYDLNGNQKWVQNYNGASNLEDKGNAITLDYFGTTVIIAAQSDLGTATAPNAAYRVLRYDAISGALMDNVGTPTQTIDSTDVPTTIWFLNSFQFCVGGGSWGGSSQRDVWVVKYDFVIAIDPGFSQTIQAYPNPAHNQLWINAGNAQVQTLSAMNALGQSISLQTQAEGETWKIDLANLTSGIYWLQVITDDGKIGTVRFVKE